MRDMSERIPFIDPTPPVSVVQALEAGQVVDWGVSAINAPAAWRLCRGSGVCVAVLDTGADVAHPDLVVAGSLSVEPGWEPVDRQGHGTHCGGIVGARDNGCGVIGVAPECTLYSIKVLDDDGHGSFEGIAKGIEMATTLGVDVISMSLGSRQKPPGDTLQRAVDRAVSCGVVVVAAAGNEYEPDGRDTVNWPAKCSGVIPVAAVDRAFAHAGFSSAGPELEGRGVSMPGVDIYSTYLNGSYAILSGTSMATPMLAGFIALMLGYHAMGDHKTPIPGRGSPERVEAVLSHLRRYVRPLGDGRMFGIGVPDGSRLGEDGD